MFDHYGHFMIPKLTRNNRKYSILEKKSDSSGRMLREIFERTPGSIPGIIPEETSGESLKELLEKQLEKSIK